MVNIVLIIIALAIALVLIAAAMQPSEFKITRNSTMNAPASVIFPHVNNLHNWEAWSPWAKLDPNAKNSFEGPPQGTGAKMSWAGNNKVGVGNMTIAESRPDDFIQFKLEFLKPIQASNTAEFTFTPNAKQTSVTWSMYGKNNFLGKLMGLIMNCDKMVGGQFEQGLQSLKAIVESQ